MFARRVTLKLKPGTAGLLTKRIEMDVLPLLRVQAGFLDEIAFLSEDGTRAFGVSLWDRKESVESYLRDAYPKVERLLAPLVEGSPYVDSYEVSNSTFHNIAAETRI